MLKIRGRESLLPSQRDSESWFLHNHLPVLARRRPISSGPRHRFLDGGTLTKAVNLKISAWSESFMAPTRISSLTSPKPLMSLSMCTKSFEAASTGSDMGANSFTNSICQEGPGFLKISENSMQL